MTSATGFGMTAGGPGKMTYRDVAEQMLDHPFTILFAIRITIKL
jgi:hypothetical protein